MSRPIRSVRTPAAVTGSRSRRAALAYCGVPLGNGYLNYTKSAGPNIIGGPCLGGNVWAFPNGTGFSQTHPDTDGDGFCDEPYHLGDDATDYLPLALTNGTPTPTLPTPYKPLSIPGRIQAEDYNLGGEGVAYHDTTPGNSGGAYRHDDVDIETGNGIIDVGWIRNGEFLTSTVNVTQAGDYLFSARVASPNSGRTIALSVDGTSALTIWVLNTGSFDRYITYIPYVPEHGYAPTVSVTQTPTPQDTENDVMLPVRIPLAAGTHVLKLSFTGDSQNLDWIEFGPFTTPTVTPTLTVTSTPTTTPTAGGASFTAAPLTAPHGSAVKFTITPATGKTVGGAWWSFDAPAHLNTWNSRAVSPTFFYPSAGTFSPLVKITYTHCSTETVQRTNYIRAT